MRCIKVCKNRAINPKSIYIHTPSHDNINPGPLKYKIAAKIMIFWKVMLCSLESSEDGSSSFSKMLVAIYQATKCHILEDHNLNIHCHENI
jgi:hypothetical protein